LVHEGVPIPHFVFVHEKDYFLILALGLIPLCFDSFLSV